MKIGVIAGTPVDTQMGVEYIQSKGYEAVSRACSKSAEEQNEMQILHKKELAELFIKLAKELLAEGAVGIFVYCNSLSGAIDLEYVRKNIPAKVITPLEVYKECASRYSSIGVIAANCQSLAAIETVILSQNKSCMVYGAGILPLVVAIETGKPSREIYDTLNIKALAEHITALGCEVFVIGCTHFPYILKELTADVATEIINPSDRMLALLLEH